MNVARKYWNICTFFVHFQANVLLNLGSPLRRGAGLRATHQLWRQRKREQLTNFDEGGRGNNSPTVMKEEGETHQLWWRKKEKLTNCDEGRRRNSPTVMKEEEGATHQQRWRKREKLTKCDEGRRGSNSPTVMKEEGETHQLWWRRKREQFTNCDEEGRRSNSPNVMKEEEGATHQQWWRKREQFTNCDEEGRGSNSPNLMKEEGATHQLWRRKGEQLTNSDEGRGSNLPTVMKKEEGATHQIWWRKREQLINCDGGRGSNSPTVMKEEVPVRSWTAASMACRRASRGPQPMEVGGSPIPVTHSGPVITMATSIIIIPPTPVTVRSSHHHGNKHYHHTTHTCCHTVRSSHHQYNKHYHHSYRGLTYICHTVMTITAMARNTIIIPMTLQVYSSHKQWQHQVWDAHSCHIEENHQCGNHCNHTNDDDSIIRGRGKWWTVPINTDRKVLGCVCLCVMYFFCKNNTWTYTPTERPPHPPLLPQKQT